MAGQSVQALRQNLGLTPAGAAERSRIGFMPRAARLRREEPTLAQRVVFADYAKGLALMLALLAYAVVAMESALNRTGWMHNAVLLLEPIIVPSVFFLSGLFMVRVMDAPWRTFADKRILNFLYFYLLWTVMAIVVTRFSLAPAARSPLWLDMARLLAPPQGALWFLLVLPLMSLVMRLLRGGPAAAILFVAALWEALSLRNSGAVLNGFSSGFVYFYAGYVLAVPVMTFQRAMFYRTSFVFCVALTFAALIGVMVFVKVPLLHSPIAPLPFASLALGVSGIAFVLCLAIGLANIKAVPDLARMGRYGLATFLLSLVLFEAFKVLFIKFIPNLGPGFLSLAAACIALGLAYPLQDMLRSSPLRFLVRRPRALRLKEPQRRAFPPLPVGLMGAPLSSVSPLPDGAPAE